MARPLRLEAEGAVYHVIARGNERKAVFRDDQDREAYGWRILQQEAGKGPCRARG